MKKPVLIIFFCTCLVTYPGAMTLGDTNGDNGVTITDALLIAQYAAGLNPSAAFNAVAADMNWDGKADINDALLVAQRCVFALPDYTVFALCQSILTEDDPQIYELMPDVNIRAIMQWSYWGDEISDYNFTAVKNHQDNTIVFTGGVTASAIFERDFANRDTFLDFATRDANNQLVPHDEVEAGVYRASLANPHYRKYMTDMCKIQIDGGVDGLFFDEVIACFSGGAVKNYNGNEGFDDYFITDFNKYLIEKYPHYTAQDWKNHYGMTDANIIKKDISPADLVNNFNYREYLQDHGWNGATAETSPLTTANPLSKEWGTIIHNRMYRADNTFLGKYTARYWLAIVNEVRKYAKEKYNKYMYITSNGIFPFVDFNCLGLYLWNPDEQTADYRGADYVPVVNGHLNGSKSLLSIYKTMYNKSRETSGDVPLVTFIDWPGEMMNNYNALPLQEKKDYWQIYASEAYACGLYPAFHVKDTVGGLTATGAGMLDFFKTYKLFYKNNKELYNHQNYRYATTSVSINRSNIAQNLMMHKEGTRYVLHLINHNYTNGIIAQENFPVTIVFNRAPQSVYMLSPDFNGPRTVAYRFDNNLLTLTIDQIIYYNVVVIL